MTNTKSKPSIGHHEELMEQSVVTLSDWYDGEHFHLNIAHYPPSGRTSEPDVERGYLFPLSQYREVRAYLNSIVHSLVWSPKFFEPRDPDAPLPVLTLELSDIQKKFVQ